MGSAGYVIGCLNKANPAKVEGFCDKDLLNILTGAIPFRRNDSIPPGSALSALALQHLS
jgi:hypothetical protein